MAHIPPGTAGRPSADMATCSPTATAEAGLAQHTESPRALRHTQYSALSSGPLSPQEEHARSLSCHHQMRPGSLPFEGLRRHQLRGPRPSDLGPKGEGIAAGSRAI